VIAAAARVALTTGVDRLADDHANARRLAEGIADIHPDAADVGAVETNMVYVDLHPLGASGPRVVEAMRKEGVITIALAEHTMRLVTHRDVSSEDVETALKSFRKVFKGA
jgi:threonine aldolase